MDSLPKDHFVKSQQFVPTTHRDIYPPIDLTQPSLSQNGKAVVITTSFGPDSDFRKIHDFATTVKDAYKTDWSWHYSCVSLKVSDCIKCWHIRMVILLIKPLIWVVGEHNIPVEM